jgi:hypothetical protein
MKLFISYCILLNQSSVQLKYLSRERLLGIDGADGQRQKKSEGKNIMSPYSHQC